MIPVYIVTGFIGAGKSTFINKQLQYRKKLGGTACISAEEGAVSPIKEGLQLNPDVLSAITPNKPDTYSSIADEIASYIDKVKPKEIWIEWNGMISFHQPEALAIVISRAIYYKSKGIISLYRPIRRIHFAWFR